MAKWKVPYTWFKHHILRLGVHFVLKSISKPIPLCDRHHKLAFPWIIVFQKVITIKISLAVHHCLNSLTVPHCFDFLTVNHCFQQLSAVYVLISNSPLLIFNNFPQFLNYQEVFSIQSSVKQGQSFYDYKQAVLHCINHNKWRPNQVLQVMLWYHSVMSPFLKKKYI